jgi:hypothetical protein
MWPFKPRPVYVLQLKIGGLTLIEQTLDGLKTTVDFNGGGHCDYFKCRKDESVVLSIVRHQKK